MILQCPKSYGIRTSDSRHTNLSIIQFEMLIFKIGLVIKENVCYAFLYVLSTYHVYQKGRQYIYKRNKANWMECLNLNILM